MISGWGCGWAMRRCTWWPGLMVTVVWQRVRTWNKRFNKLSKFSKNNNIELAIISRLQRMRPPPSSLGVKLLLIQHWYSMSIQREETHLLSKENGRYFGSWNISRPQNLLYTNISPVCSPVLFFQWSQPHTSCVRYVIQKNHGFLFDIFIKEVYCAGPKV